MAAEGYWRYPDMRQPAAAGGGSVIGAGAAAVPGASAGAVSAAPVPAVPVGGMPSLKRPRSDYGPEIGGYYGREDSESFSASYDRYFRSGMPPAFEPTRPVAAGMAGYPVVDQRLIVGGDMNGRSMGFGDARQDVTLPPDASNTLFVAGLPVHCTRREVSHIFRPFVGFREVRLVNKEARHPGEDPVTLCFVDFETAAQAAMAMEALQGYKFDEHDRESPVLRLQFARFAGPRSGGGRGRR